MATLYAGNNTKHKLVLHYRMPEQTRAFSVTIPMGGQERLPHDLTQQEIDNILGQWKHYNPVEAGAVDRTRGPTDLTYRIEKPITSDSLQSGVEKNEAAAIERSDRVFTESGVALGEMLAKRGAEEGNTLTSVKLSAQEDFVGTKPKNVIAKGIEVTPRGVRKT
jgi:hypothetical protein